MTVSQNSVAQNPTDSLTDFHKLGQIFNTALVCSQSNLGQSAHGEFQIEKVIQSNAYRSLLRAVHSLSQERGCSEKEAASELVQLFREIDAFWNRFLLKEGLSHLQKSKT